MHPKTKAPRKSSASIDCPHCGQSAPVRTSRQVTRLYRELYHQCSNLDCGHTFASALSITHTISQSACPDHSVDLPVAPIRQRAGNDNDRIIRPRAAKGDHPRPANT
ncbi:MULTISPECIES: ogr/Delta-like zinc finger family protein [unclassified Erythrobacter]|uniref:ogr/Delta-like zinc finger family protein n=1 Tax=unclassified Erythrobacter TaxID=2633097 RepID=UPI0009ED9E87